MESKSGEASMVTETKGKALLVEDNPFAAEATSLVLVDFGYFVCEVDTAAAAMRAIERHKFDLVLSDISLPGGISGIGLAKYIRQKYPDIPIVLATGFSQLTQEVAGQFIVLQKPYRVEDLRAAIATEVQLAASSARRAP